MHRIKNIWNGFAGFFKKHFFKKTVMPNRDTVRYIPKGHTVFKYNIKSLSLTTARCEMEDFVKPDKTIEKRKTIRMQPGCIYWSGLNRQTVIKKMAREKFKVTSGETEKVPKQPKGTDVYFKMFDKKMLEDFNGKLVSKQKQK